jgi:O-antigen ligase
MLMMNSPVSLITGFGWDTWSVMGFYYVSHNYYLSLWFEIGLVGVVGFLLILRQLVTTALITAAVADAYDRNFIVAFVFSFLILAISIFFVLLFKPWTYLWLYIGLAMRYTVNVRAASRINLNLQPEKNSPQAIGHVTAPARSVQTK